MAVFNDFSKGQPFRVAHAPVHDPASNGTMHTHMPVEFPPMTQLAGKGFHSAGHITAPQHVTGHRGEPRLRNTQPPASM